MDEKFYQNEYPYQIEVLLIHKLVLTGKMYDFHSFQFTKYYIYVRFWSKYTDLCL